MSYVCVTRVKYSMPIAPWFSTELASPHPMPDKTEVGMRRALLDRRELLGRWFENVTLDVETKGFELVTKLNQARPIVEAVAFDLVSEQLDWDKTQTFAFEPFPCTENDAAPINQNQSISNYSEHSGYSE